MSNVQIAELLQWIKNLWGLIPKHYLIVLYFGGTVFAFLNCFMGYRLRKVWGCILGILIGGGAGAAAGYFLLQDKMMAILCAAGGALILGLLAWLLYKFGIFFMCTGLVYFLVVSFFQEPTMTQHMIALVAGIFAATLALGYEAQMMIGITAVCGGIGGIHLLMKMLEKDAFLCRGAARRRRSSWPFGQATVGRLRHSRILSGKPARRSFRANTARQYRRHGCAPGGKPAPHGVCRF